MVERCVDVKLPQIAGLYSVLQVDLFEIDEHFWASLIDKANSKGDET